MCHTVLPSSTVWGGFLGKWNPHAPHCPPQACHVEGGSAGLIPSQLLEEKRKAFVKRDLEVASTSGMKLSAPLWVPSSHSNVLVPWCCP